MRFKEFLNEDNSRDSQFFDNKEDIHDWCSEYIKGGKFSINDDLTVDGSFVIIAYEENLYELPVQFNIVKGDFSILYCENLSTLKGAPLTVSNSFDCSYNNLSTLEHCPKNIENNLICIGNDLRSLKGCPNEIGGTLDCSENMLQDLTGAPKYVAANFICSRGVLKSLKGGPREVGNDYLCSHNKLTSLEGAARHIGGGLYARFNNFNGEPDTSKIDIQGDFIWD